MSALLKKPRKWAFSPGLVAPEWAWARKHIVYEFVFWEGTGNPVELIENRVVSRGGTTGWQAGPFGLEYKFNGTDMHLAIDGHELLSFSHECLVIPRINGADSIAVIAETPGNSTNDRSFGISDAGSFKFHIFDGGVKVAEGGTPVINIPVHLIGTADRSNIELFVDGVSVDIVSAGDAFDFTSPELILGRGPVIGGASDFKSSASIVMFRVWDIPIRDVLAAQLARDPFDLFRMDDEVGVVVVVPVVDTSPEEDAGLFTVGQHQPRFDPPEVVGY